MGLTGPTWGPGVCASAFPDGDTSYTPLDDHPLATHCEPSALHCWILEILNCTPKGRRASLRIPSTEGRSVCPCWAPSRPKGPKGLDRISELRALDVGAPLSVSGETGSSRESTRTACSQGPRTPEQSRKVRPSQDHQDNNPIQYSKRCNPRLSIRIISLSIPSSALRSLRF